MQVSSITQIIKSKEHSIARLKKDYSDEVVKAMLVVEFDQFLRFFNLSKTIDEFQLVETIKIIQKHFYYLSILDFKLFFNKVKMGYYGNMYGKIDGSFILKSLGEYDAERINAFHEVRAKENRIRKKNEKSSPMSEEVAKKLRDIVGEKPVQKTTKKTVDKSPIQRWMKQFDNLFLKYGESKGIRTIIINGNRMTVNQFLEKKIKNHEHRKSKGNI